MAGLYEMVMHGLQLADEGRERKKERTLAGLLSKAYSAQGDEREGFIGQAVALNPTAGLAAKGQFRQMDDDAKARVAQHAQLFAEMPDEQKAVNYPRLAAEVRQITGIEGIPDVYDPKMLPMIQKLASNGNPGFNNTVQSQRVGEDGFIYTTMRDGTMVNTGIKADRQMWLRDYPGMTPELVGKDGQVRPVGGIMPQQPMSQPGNPFDQFSQAFPNVQVTSGLRTPEHNREVGGVDNSFHLTGQARDIVPPRTPQEAARLKAWGDANGIEWIPEGDHWHGEPRGRAPRMPQGVAQARPSEAQTAADVEAAKQVVQMQYLPQQKAIERDSAIQQAAGVASAQKQVDAQTDLPRINDTADQTIALLRKVLSHPGKAAATGLSSTFDPRNRIPGTDAYNFNVLMDQVKGKAFLEAFASLKGGGQITEVEGKKATDAIARINTAQSQEEFDAGVRELLGIAEQAKSRARNAAGKASGPRIGEVQDGYRYRGGNPSDPNSWERI